MHNLPEKSVNTFGQLDEFQATSPSLGDLDRFIPALPREYQTFAHLIWATAIDPEYALSLHVKFVEDLWQRHGFVNAMRLLSSISFSDVAPYLLVTEIRGRRSKTLQRNKVAPENQPPHVFLDYKARPITKAMAEAAFSRASRRIKLVEPMTPDHIRGAAIAAFDGS